MKWAAPFSAADGVHVPGHLAGGAAAGALEEHMLDEVGGAVLPGGLVAGADADEEAQGGGAGPGDLLQQEPGPIGQSKLLIHAKTSICSVERMDAV